MTGPSGADHFGVYHRAWADLTPPLRPHRDVVVAMTRALGEPGGPTLLLGVTPELADIAPDLIAVDRNQTMIHHVWPGDTDLRKALVGDWRSLAFAPGTFAACVGDGSFIAARYPDEHAVLFAELARVLRSNAAVVLRIYLRPDAQVSASGLREAAMTGGFHNFHAFKLRLGMALASETQSPNVMVQLMVDTFNRMFPDRAALSRETGWVRRQIDTIDFYEGSSASYSFPSRQELSAMVPSAFVDQHIVPSGSYELAECCPLLILRRR